MKIVFLGTADFAIPSLEALKASGHEIVQVLTQPDRAKGRGHHLRESALKERARDLGLPIFQPESVKEAEVLKRLEDLRPELLCVVAYGQILPEALLSLPSRMPLNVHASLLPKYRGAAPIEWAVARGESETGVCIQRMVKRLDAGDILLSRSLPIGESDAANLTEALSQLGAQTLLEALRLIESGNFELKAQDESQASYAPLLTKKDGILDFKESASALRRREQAFAARPGIFSAFRGEVLRLRGLKPGEASDRPPFEILTHGPWGLQVACGHLESVWISELQSPGAKSLPAEAWARGKRLSPGEHLEMPLI